ncbi:MAG: hypothetical protein NTZ09_11055 [Candidatus Hydrogenedentes bacterium]|nr:hypothetical protein [Candidatus Hydrogenedentota bacterium]
MIARGTVRNTMVVLSLFGLAALTIVVAHFRAPYIPYEEPPELVAKRLDRENNSYYGLVDAAALLPPIPPYLDQVKDADGVEHWFELEPGSVGSLLSVCRPDDDPLLLEYIDKSKPAVELARAAASKPFFLFPPVDWTAGKQLDGSIFENMLLLHQLIGLLFLDAASKPCSPDPAEDGCRLMQETLRLSFRINADRYWATVFAESVAIDAIRRSCDEHQREMLQWLEETRRAWAPQRATLDYMIRRVLKAEAVVDLPFRPTRLQRVYYNVSAQLELSRQKYFVRRHEPLFQAAAQLTFHQYQQQKERFSVLDTPPRGRGHLYLCLHTVIIDTNSRFFATVDGLRIAIALELYRRGHGTYPDSLDSLAPNFLPEVPKSPYDGEDFNYNQEGDDYQLSCVIMRSDYASVSRAGKLIFHIPAGAESAP